MKRLITVLFFTLAMATVCLNAMGKGPDKKQVYAFGYGTCLGDSIVYISAIQVLEGAEFDKKTGFLNDRNIYSYQMEQGLRTYFNKHFTCAVFYSDNKAKLEKRYFSLKKQLGRDKAVRVEELPSATFRFTAIPVVTDGNAVAADEKAE